MSTEDKTPERPVPYKPRMPRLNRAKLFAPYDALKPFESTVHAKDTVYVRRKEPAEFAQECLDQRLRRLKRGDVVAVTWFRATETDRDSGQYLTGTGTVTKIDRICRVIYLDKLAIPVRDILDLYGENEESAFSESSCR